ncbi:MAG: biopolymer transporter ExbD [Bdellovibrionales bacterium]|nr:biopolymer transporter ExbD [Bdellovibrionales bacterium]
MLKRPSSRRRSHPAEIQINLVPMLDALVTMISFLMYTMAFLSFTMIESPLPIVSPETNQHQLRDRPLQLTLTINEKDLLLWSPFDLIPQRTIQNKQDGQPDVLKLHEALIAIKQKFLTENKLILVPKGVTSYDTIVAVIDAAKALEKTDPIIVIKNEKTGVQEQAKTLFGEVVFGNLLGGDE